MRFGDYIREIRQGLRWTQPEAAKEIGIEQSYLSKLESGKSYPSEDVFSSLKTIYKIDLSDLRKKVFAADLDRLREISEVRAVILSNEQDFHKRVQHWLMAGVGAFVIGGACLGAGMLAEDKDITKFQYKSQGVTLEGESVEEFAIIGEGPFDNDPDSQSLKNKQDEMMNRLDEQYLAIEDYRGVVFFESVDDGKRVWRFYGSTTETLKSSLRWFFIPAMAFLMLGFGCFFASYRSK